MRLMLMIGTQSEEIYRERFPESMRTNKGTTAAATTARFQAYSFRLYSNFIRASSLVASAACREAAASN